MQMMTKKLVSKFPRDEEGTTSSNDTTSEFTDYIVSVKTSNRFGAGTDAKVYVQLCGQVQYSEPLCLKTSENVNKFERNQLDNFTFKDVISVGDIKAVNVWHDNSGFGAAWHLEYLEVSDIFTGLKYRFPCHRWFSTTEDDGKISRQVKCTEVTAGPKQAVQLALGVPKKFSLDSTVITINADKDQSTAARIIPKQAILVNAVKRSSASSQDSLSSSPSSSSVYGPYSSSKHNQDHSNPRRKISQSSPYGPYSNR